MPYLHGFNSLSTLNSGASLFIFWTPLPSYIIHTVGPRYNLKYKTAAESALHNCYRASMELVKEYELSSIGFTVINSSRRGYPADLGAHLALSKDSHPALAYTLPLNSPPNSSLPFP